MFIKANLWQEGGALVTPVSLFRPVGRSHCRRGQHQCLNTGNSLALTGPLLGSHVPCEQMCFKCTLSTASLLAVGCWQDARRQGHQRHSFQHSCLLMCISAIQDLLLSKKKGGSSRQGAPHPKNADPGSLGDSGRRAVM